MVTRRSLGRVGICDLDRLSACFATANFGPSLLRFLRREINMQSPFEPLTGTVVGLPGLGLALRRITNWRWVTRKHTLLGST